VRVFDLGTVGTFSPLSRVQTTIGKPNKLGMMIQVEDAQDVTRIKIRTGVKADGLSIHILNRDEHPPAHAHVVRGDNPKNGP
jgi:hypothetical protein